MKNSTTKIPCTHTRHSWKDFGGLKENPGYYGIGGTAIRHTQQCRHCGIFRDEIFGDVNTCGNRNRGWRVTHECQ